MQPDSGVTIHQPGKCSTGYTLYSSRQTEIAHLIDTTGREVHAWSYLQGETWHYAEMLPNGHLLAIIKEVEDECPGMIVELDWGSQLVWKADVPAHHDLDRLASGNTLAVCREYVTDERLRAGTLKSDYLVEMTPDGQAVWEWHAHEHVGEIAELVPVELPLEHRDWAHTNTVESLPPNAAAKQDARFKPGNVLFSARNIDTIGVVEKDSGQVVWAWGPGVLDRQHMPTMLPDGHILVYDNGTGRGYTRILEMDPLTGEVLWEYSADPPASFFSPTRGSNQRLPNGNTFIAESDNGRLFEVTSDGEVVWEFLTPDLTPRGRRQPLYRAMRYEPELVERLLAEAKQL
ncbi:MAG: aryl-sulfate sulfotransferase [Armatimonadota bacterium]